MSCPTLAAESVLEQAATLRAAGQFDEALDVLRAESREIKRVEGEDSPRLLAVNDLAAEVLVDMGSLDTAAALLDKTIAAREKLVATGRGEESTLLGGSLLTWARLETAAKRLPAAVDTTRRALLAFAAAPEPDSEGVRRAREAVQAAIESLDGLLGAGAAATRQARGDVATAYASLGMFPEAVEQRRRILAGLLAGGDASATDIVSACDRLGLVMMDAGEADEAADLVDAALAKLGPTQAVAEVPLRRLLGELQVAAERFVLAEDSFARALAATRSAAKPSAVVEAADRMHTFLVALLRGEAEQLPDWYPAAVKNLERAPRTEAAQAIAGLVSAARVQEEIGDPAAAAALAGRALDFANSIAPPDARQVADLSARLGRLQLAAGNLAAALKTVERALPVAERQLGPGDAGVSSLRIVLAGILSRQGDMEKAVAMAATALERPLPRPTDGWEELATAIYDRLAEKEGQADLRDKYLAARVAQFGETHPHVAAACGLFGAARLAAGDWPAAVDFLARAHDICRAGGGDDEPETAASLVLLAHAERMAGDAERAAGTAARALAAWERIAGADHPGAIAAAEVLVAAKMQSGDMTGVVELLERLSGPAAGVDSAHRAAHLVRLADLTAARDKARAKKLLAEAMQLPCWPADTGLDLAGRRQLAFAAAVAAHAFGLVGDPDAAKESLQLARGIAMQAEDPKPLLDRVEQLASRGDRPTAGP
ncbi:MAG: tetratricopeptide repeat protein [Planctomycetota bacterium]